MITVQVPGKVKKRIVKAGQQLPPTDESCISSEDDLRDLDKGKGRGSLAGRANHRKDVGPDCNSLKDGQVHIHLV